MKVIVSSIRTHKLTGFRIQKSMMIIVDTNPIKFGGSASLTVPNEKILQAKMNLIINGLPDSHYWIVTTDFVNYSVTWSCFYFNDCFLSITNKEFLFRKSLDIITKSKINDRNPNNCR